MDCNGLGWLELDWIVSLIRLVGRLVDLLLFLRRSN